METILKSLLELRSLTQNHQPTPRLRAFPIRRIDMRSLRLMASMFLIFAVFILLSVCKAAGDSPNLQGKWLIQQKNASGATFKGTWILEQNGSVIKGSALWENHMQGIIQGSLQGSTVELTIAYSDGLKGTYTALLASDCSRLRNGTSQANRGSDFATWQGERIVSVDGKWSVQQKNTSGATFRGSWVLTQDGSKITGVVSWENHPEGRIQGSLKGKQLELVISYVNDLKGTYMGTITTACRLSANGSSTSNQGSDTATWQAEHD